MEIKIAKINLVTANAAYPVQIPRGTTRFYLQTRDGTAWRFATTEGVAKENVEGVWTVISVSSKALYESGSVRFAEPQTLYAACASAAKILEAMFYINTIEESGGE